MVHLRVNRWQILLIWKLHLGAAALSTQACRERLACMRWTPMKNRPEFVRPGTATEAKVCSHERPQQPLSIQLQCCHPVENRKPQRQPTAPV